MPSNFIKIKTNAKLIKGIKMVQSTLTLFWTDKNTTRGIICWEVENSIYEKSEPNKKNREKYLYILMREISYK